VYIRKPSCRVLLFINRKAREILLDFYIVLVTKWQIPSCSDGEVEAVTTFSSLSVNEPDKSDQATVTISNPIVKDQSPVNNSKPSVEEIKASLKLNNVSSSQQDQTLNQESNQTLINTTASHPPQSLQRSSELQSGGSCDATVTSSPISCTNVLGTPVDRYTPPILLTNNGKCVKCDCKHATLHVFSD